MINCHDAETFFCCQYRMTDRRKCCYVLPYTGRVSYWRTSRLSLDDDNGRVMSSELVVDWEAVDASDNNACRELVK